jgi:hypothetical protein
MIRGRKKIKWVNPQQQRRTTEMLRLVHRYGELAETQHWQMMYSWNLAYCEIDEYGQPAGELQYQEFFCYTNNLVFAAMIFQAQMLTEGHHVTVGYIEFNSRV